MKEHNEKNSLFNLLKILIIFSSILSILTGCGSAIQKKSPPIAHVHIGHTLKGWVTTPNKAGLLATAQQEAKITLAQSLKAKSSPSLIQKKKNMANALHALDPKIQPKGLGKGFGLTRAITESIAHIQFAANSDDASVNVKKSVPPMVKKAQQIASSSNQLSIFGQAAINSTSVSEFNALNDEFLTLANQINGIGNTNSYSLQQFDNDIQAMIAREKPAYTTVDKYYLFNLIRLPSGKWAFKSKSKPSSSYNSY